MKISDAYNKNNVQVKLNSSNLKIIVRNPNSYSRAWNQPDSGRKSVARISFRYLEIGISVDANCVFFPEFFLVFWAEPTTFFSRQFLSRGSPNPLSRNLFVCNYNYCSGSRAKILISSSIQLFMHSHSSKVNADERNKFSELKFHAEW